MEEKKYLFVADIKNEAERFEKVTQAFMRKALFTNAILVVAMDATVEDCRYRKRVENAIFGGGEIRFHFQRRIPH